MALVVLGTRTDLVVSGRNPEARHEPSPRQPAFRSLAAGDAACKRLRTLSVTLLLERGNVKLSVFPPSRTNDPSPHQLGWWNLYRFAADSCASFDAPLAHFATAAPFRTDCMCALAYRLIVLARPFTSQSLCGFCRPGSRLKRYGQAKPPQCEPLSGSKCLSTGDLSLQEMRDAIDSWFFSGCRLSPASLPVMSRAPRLNVK